MIICSAEYRLRNKDLDSNYLRIFLRMSFQGCKKFQTFNEREHIVKTFTVNLMWTSIDYFWLSMPLVEFPTLSWYDTACFVPANMHPLICRPAKPKRLSSFPVRKKALSHHSANILWELGTWYFLRAMLACSCISLNTLCHLIDRNPWCQ